MQHYVQGFTVATEWIATHESEGAWQTQKQDKLVNNASVEK